MGSKHATVLARARRAHEKSPMDEFLLRIGGDEIVIARCAFCTFTATGAVVERVVLEPGDVERLAGEMRPPYDAAIIVGA
jgi:hypothetical protein